MSESRDVKILRPKVNLFLEKTVLYLRMMFFDNLIISDKSIDKIERTLYSINILYVLHHKFK